MRYLLAGLLMSLMAVHLGVAQDATENADDGDSSKYEVTGIDLYQGPGYSSIDSEPGDISADPQFHSFGHRPVDEVGYSPLTLDDFRYPVVSRVREEFHLERLYYPDHSMLVWHDKPNQFKVTAFFFTRDMIRDHIQQVIDTYYVGEDDLVQQLIDYYAEVTPQYGEAISWVWFSIDERNHVNSDQRGNRYFENYLGNFKDKFHLEFGLPKVQDIVDENVRDFLYQYRHRGKHHCGADFQDTGSCDACPKCGQFDCTPTPCPSCPTSKCDVCPVGYSEPHDKPLKCCDYSVDGFDLDLNNHYLYAPRKVIIEDMTFDPLAQAYRWKFAWRFNDCEIDWLKQMCAYGQFVEMRLVISDPHWFTTKELPKQIKRDLLAAMDPDTWGNIWSAGNLPFDTTNCDCQLPTCDGNCQVAQAVGWGYVEPTPMAEMPPMVMPPPAPPAPVPSNDFSYFPSGDEEVASVPGRG